ncbi:MAG: methyl-accepting chemotaxis protein [Gammaproteobacteria bacterium]
MAKKRKPVRAPVARKVAVDALQLADLQGQLAAIGKAQAVIEFDLEGRILTANDNFLTTLGYRIEEVRGQHHSMFVDAAFRSSDDYRRFWEKLGRGEYDAGQYKRIGKGGKEVWIQASYNPILDAGGKPFKVVKYATDITSQVVTAAENKGQLAAINRAQAVIEFDLEGRILTANENFLSTVGYRLEEVRGQHHSMFVDPVYRASDDYRRFWEKLGRGEYDANQYKRIAKGGKEVWIQASYNPIFNADGKPYKVVKYATNITAQVVTAAENKGQLAAINRAQAVIEFDLEGRILTANDNFLTTLGYRIEEVRGQHHSMFVDPVYRAGDEYKRFWEKLGRGEYDANQYKRIAKGGREVWIQASYNPILDADGRPYKVVKYATDVTAQVMLSRQMQEAVAQTQDVIKSATDGDLTRRLNGEDKTGDLRAMADSINGLLTAMAEIVGSVKGAAGQVFRGAEEISQGNANLSQRTEEQSSSLEETASSMEQMTSTVKQNADNAGQANQLATAARDQAEKGGAVVGKAVRAMTEINESSKKIADIISVIDEIAFQTNLLALNAAVEAARAGEQGRGFAVVATEVRSLAGRSATAAKEIKDLIQDSVKKVEDGSTLVTQSGQTLEQIVASVKKVSDIVAEIAAASREQSTGIEQVNKAVMQMDEMTQQNAALVEEATAASQSMAEQARALNEMMERYQLGDEVEAANQSSRPAPRASAARATPPAAAKAPERRGGKRPWSGKPAASAAGEPRSEGAAPARAAAGGGDVDWKEF